MIRVMLPHDGRDDWGGVYANGNGCGRGYGRSLGGGWGVGSGDGLGSGRGSGHQAKWWAFIFSETRLSLW